MKYYIIITDRTIGEELDRRKKKFSELKYMTIVREKDEQLLYHNYCSYQSTLFNELPLSDEDFQKQASRARDVRASSLYGRQFLGREVIAFMNFAKKEANSKVYEVSCIMEMWNVLFPDLFREVSHHRVNYTELQKNVKDMIEELPELSQEAVGRKKSFRNHIIYNGAWNSHYFVNDKNNHHYTLRYLWSEHIKLTHSDSGHYSTYNLVNSSNYFNSRNTNYRAWKTTKKQQELITKKAQQLYDVVHHINRLCNKTIFTTELVAV